MPRPVYTETNILTSPVAGSIGQYYDVAVTVVLYIVMTTTNIRLDPVGLEEVLRGKEDKQLRLRRAESAAVSVLRRTLLRGLASRCRPHGPKLSSRWVIGV